MEKEVSFDLAGDYRENTDEIVFDAASDVTISSADRTRTSYFEKEEINLRGIIGECLKGEPSFYAQIEVQNVIGERDAVVCLVLDRINVKKKNNVMFEEVFLRIIESLLNNGFSVDEELKKFKATNERFDSKIVEKIFRTSSLPILSKKEKENE